LRRITAVFLKVSAASLVMGLAASGLYGLMYVWTGSNALSLSVTILAAVCLYVVLILLLRVDEVQKLKALILSRIGRVMPVPTPQDTDVGM
jgi:putative peptidoglycan lipid II flippase